MNFIHENFLLQSSAARQLYHEFAIGEPILDFHSHLPAQEIADDRQFKDLSEIWLEGDHYKWRAMRANGVAECYCTGDAGSYEKFLAWARTVPFTVRNPLYHWTHLELARYFGIDELLDEASARSIWEHANRLLQGDGLSARGILRKFQVQVVCTSDDPSDDLDHHKRVNSGDTNLRIYPTFRPDQALQVDDPGRFNAWLERLQAASNVDVNSLSAMLEALKRRHQAFHACGGRLSDHGLEYCYATPCTEEKAAQVFNKVRACKPATPDEYELFASFMMLFFGHLDAEKGWTKQLHLGALRNVSSRKLQIHGPNTGFDSIGDWPHARSLSAYLDLLQRENALPKMVLYNLSPADNYIFATVAGSFQEGAIPGKIQFGSGWWFLDQKQGIEAQLNALSNTGLLSRFIGMVTDSRSFMSFTRHEYFRRVLCNLLGREIESGELPNDMELIGGTVRNICYENARQFLGLEVPQPAHYAGPTAQMRT